MIISNRKDGSGAMRKTGEKFIELQGVVARLRAEDGCPWDRKQTPESLKAYLVEETYEVLEALDDEDSGLVREELGDLLFMVVLLNQIYQEKELFSMAEVISGISEKMIRRHPHVFGDKVVDSEEKLRDRWHRIKAGEKAANGDKNMGTFASIPKSLPALRKAQKVSERAARLGFEWPDLEMAQDKLTEEITELKEALAGGEKQAIAEEMGDVLFALACISRLAGVNAEDSLSFSTSKFVDRFYEMERLLGKKGEPKFSGFDAPSLMQLWAKAKKKSCR